MSGFFCYTVNQDATMELTNQALEPIGNYVRSNLGTWIDQLGSTTTPFRHVDEQFQHVGTRREKNESRLDAVEVCLEKVDTRFEAFEKRFDDLSREVVPGFTVMTRTLGAIGIVVTIAFVF